MGKINVLDKSVAQLIAAGEVVERPASVIKELVENSIDSGATKITVEIENGGVTYIRVSDNGCGIAKDDVKNAFVSHATSKVLTSQDLESIMTMGFRGEALASICAVSRVTLISATSDSDIGLKYVIEGGEELLFDDTGCAMGTTITVERLFFNTPARMKFLKKDVSEGNAIASVMDKLALSHPNISFSFIRDSKEIFNTPGNSNLKSTIYSIYGREFTDSLLEVDYMLNGIEVNGFVSVPSKAKNNRTMQIFFVNDRLVISRTMSVAIEQAFKGCLVKGKFPACVLFLKMSPNVVDINVHPAKTEIRFADEKYVFDAIYYAIKSTLMKDDGISDLTLDSKQDEIDKTGSQTVVEQEIKIYTEPEKSERKPEEKLSEEPKDFDDDFLLTAPKKVKRINLIDESEPEKEEVAEQSAEEIKTQVDVQETVPTYDSGNQEVFYEVEKNKEDAKYIGELFKTYIIVQKGDEMLLIDKHAAHERQIYEKLKNRKVRAYPQILLTPIVVPLTSEEHSCALENADKLADLGFDVDDFGNNNVVVRSIPSEFNINVTKDILHGALECFIKGVNSEFNEVVDNIYHTMACRAAIKAGDLNMNEELMELALKVREEELKYCPHGRPTTISISKKTIEKKFKRT